MCRLASCLAANTNAELQAQLLETQEQSRLQAAAARDEAAQARSQLSDALGQVAELQQQLASLQERHAAISSSCRQLEEAAEPGLVAKIHSEAR